MTDDDKLPKSSAPVKTANGKARSFLRMTDVVCATCKRGAMGVVKDHGSSLTVECERCGQTQHIMPPASEVKWMVPPKSKPKPKP